MQAVGWMSIAWHTVMPCAVFIVAYGRIFFTVRRLLKIIQTAPAAAAAAAQHSVAPQRGMTAVENPGRSEAATSVQPGPTRAEVTHTSTGRARRRATAVCDNLDQQVMLQTGSLALSSTCCTRWCWWFCCSWSATSRPESTSLSSHLGFALSISYRPTVV